MSTKSWELQQLQHDSVEEEMAIFRRALERARELGQLRDGVNTASSARIIHAGLTGVLYSAMLEPTQFDLERDSREMLDALMAHYVKPGVFEPGADPSPLPPPDED